MPRLPSQLTYNDLNGQEATDILADWFRQLVRSHPQFQPHLTLPMAKITLSIDIQVDMYIGGTVPVSSPPETLDIRGGVTLDNRLSAAPAFDGARSRQASGLDATSTLSGLFGPAGSGPVHLSAVVNAAPEPGGVPPDQIREQHGLPIPRPAYGPRETGSHLFLSDVLAETEKSMQSALSASGGRQGEVAPGYVFSSEPVHKTVEVLDQTIDLGGGEIQIDLAGKGIHHAGMLVKDDTHRKSVKAFGDKAGDRYSSVNGVYDAGPAGLMNNRGGGGLGSDGRQKISFGNNR
jgi:hypothetical protein